MFIADAHCDALYSIAIEKKAPASLMITPQHMAAASESYLQTFALFAGKHVVAIGSYQPHTRELPRSATERAEGIWLDTMFAAEESGDLAIPLAEGWLKRESLQPFCDIVAAGVEAAAPWRSCALR